MLTAAVLAGPSAALAQSGGAGDNQYQDPFGSGSGSSSSSGSSTHRSSSGSSSNGLSQSSGLSSSSSSSSTTSPSATSPTSATSGQLPNTGSDPRLIILAGLALLLFGIGLRLRTADESF